MLTKNGMLKCDVCGKFINTMDLYEDTRVSFRVAKHVLVTPDAEGTPETWKSLCPEHNDEDI